MSMRKPVVLVPVALLLAACSGSTAAGPSASAGPSAPADPVVVHVTGTEFAIESDRTAFQVGVPYEFEVTNEGTIAHEVMLMPVMSGEGMDMEQMDKVALGIAEEEDLVPGATVDFTVTFDEGDVGGSLEFACHVPGHYEAGMHLPITVTSN